MKATLTIEVESVAVPMVAILMGEGAKHLGAVLSGRGQQGEGPQVIAEFEKPSAFDDFQKTVVDGIASTLGIPVTVSVKFSTDATKGAAPMTEPD